MDASLIKEGINIMIKFGPRHAWGRYKDSVAIQREESRRNNLYEKIKPEGVLVKDILGSKMQLDMADYGIHRDLFLDGVKEPMATAHLKEVLSKNDIVLEIGANIGYYALLESRMCKKVYALEPIPENANNLNINIGLNQYSNIELFQIALGEAKGSRYINLSAKSNWHSFYPIKGAVAKQLIEMDTADNFLSGKESPTFVRMDVEGYELSVIKGMRNTLKKISRLFIEVHAQIMKLGETQELLGILKQENFSPEKIIKYDKPAFSRVIPNTYIDKIRRGDKGVYLIFFNKNQA